MSDLAKRETITPPVGQTLMEKGVAKLRQHAELKAMAFDYADFITKTGSCPDIYRNKPMDAAAAIIRGTALGFDPDGALEAFFVIKGKTGMYARAMIAVAENAGCRVWEDEASDESVTWSGTRPGDSKVETVTWTMKRAQNAGYTSNGRYKTNPQEMLRSKCQAELARILAPGALMGLYSEHEPAAFEQPVRATAVRRDKPAGRGAAGLAAALQTSTAGGGVEEEPAELTKLGEVATEAITAIESVTQRDELKGILDAFGEHLDADEFAVVREVGTRRWHELGTTEGGDHE